MKSMLKLLTAAIVSLAFAGAAAGQAIFPDTYWGGQPTNPVYKDVVGSFDTFDLSHVETTVSGASVTINIYGNYFDNILSGEDLFKTTMGDLFISVDGLAYNDVEADTLDDYFQSPTSYTTWEYAVRLGTYYNMNGVLDDEAVQFGTVHAITENDVVLTTPNGYTNYRANQEWQIDPESRIVGGATWYIGSTGDGPNSNFLSIIIEDFGNIIGLPTDSAIHWTMSCGNDVVETPIVPEPSTIGILGAAGMAVLLVVRRRFTRK
jgi:hypothetical protein